MIDSFIAPFYDTPDARRRLLLNFRHDLNAEYFDKQAAVLELPVTAKRQYRRRYYLIITARPVEPCANCNHQASQAQRLDNVFRGKNYDSGKFMGLTERNGA
jgi:hypothetical protein